jgi:hypothetical protein
MRLSSSEVSRVTPDPGSCVHDVSLDRSSDAAALRARRIACSRGPSMPVHHAFIASPCRPKCCLDGHAHCLRRGLRPRTPRPRADVDGAREPRPRHGGDRILRHPRSTAQRLDGDSPSSRAGCRACGVRARGLGACPRGSAGADRPVRSGRARCPTTDGRSAHVATRGRDPSAARIRAALGRRLTVLSQSASSTPLEDRPSGSGRSG